MKRVKNIIVIIGLLISTLAFAQNDLKARVEFEEAEKQFNESNFPEALMYLEKTEALIGKWTPKVSFMKIESLYNMANLSDLESENSKKLIKEVTLYMDYCEKQKDNVVLEKFKLVYAIDEEIKQLKKLALEIKMPEYVDGFVPYEKGDYALAMSLWSKAAAKGNSEAFCIIGSLYEKGLGVSKDYSKAMEWYLKGANMGNTTSMFNIGVFYLYGYGVTQDNAKSVNWIIQAAQKGNENAMRNIGQFYHKGEAGLEKDYVKALEWYQRAAKRGNSRAMVSLGFFYANGMGVEINKSKAMEWWKKAADQGSELGMFNIASSYRDGDGVAKDYAKALEWYAKANAKEFVDSLKEMAAIYEEGGYGVTRDKKKAAELRTEYLTKTAK